MSDYLQQQSTREQRQRRNRIILSGIILATLPFYCAGIAAYVLAPRGVDALPTNTPTLPPNAVVTEAATLTPLPTEAAATFTMAPTLQPTPTQPLGIPTTRVPLATATPAVTNTPIPTITPLPSNTPIPSDTPPPAATSTPIPFD